MGSRYFGAIEATDQRVGINSGNSSLFAHARPSGGDASQPLATFSRTACAKWRRSSTNCLAVARGSNWCWFALQRGLEKSCCFAEHCNLASQTFTHPIVAIVVVGLLFGLAQLVVCNVFCRGNADRMLFRLADAGIRRSGRADCGPRVVRFCSNRNHPPRANSNAKKVVKSPSEARRNIKSYEGHRSVSPAAWCASRVGSGSR